jgi:biopolymer transport protein ExbB
MCDETTQGPFSVTTPNLRDFRFLVPAVALAEVMAPIGALAQTVASGSVPPVAPVAADAPPVAAALGLLPSDFSPWGMFRSADDVVKVVICALAFAVVITWTIWLAKTLELAMAKRRVWPRLAAEWLSESHGVGRALVRAAREWHASADALDDRDGLKERIALHLERVEAATG